MPDYKPQSIEQKWQDRWRSERTFEVTEDPAKPKFYCLEMFAYPSGHAHVGHVRNYMIGDVVARMKRMRGFNVLHPFGWDAFGLPAENAAIKNGTHPEKWTLENIAHMKGQLQRLGISYAWEREIATCLPEYYRWNQWLFVKMLERDLAYRRRSNVNWCPSCQTVLANEQVDRRRLLALRHAGRDPRARAVVLPHHHVRGRTARGHRPPARMARQGPDDAAELDRAIGGCPGHVPARAEPCRYRRAARRPSTSSRPDRHDLRRQLPDAGAGASARPAVGRRAAEADSFRDNLKRFQAQDRTARLTGEVEKEGFATGRSAINPFTKQPVPVWVANFVLVEYGTGAVMGVPAHDQRDFEFARKYGLPVTVVVQPDGERLSGETLHGGLRRPRHARELGRVRRPDRRRMRITRMAEHAESAEDWRAHRAVSG